MQKGNKPIPGRQKIGKLRWEISVDDSSEKPSRPGKIPYQLTFIFWNGYDFPLRVKVHVTSPSKGFVFRKRIFKKFGGSRITKVDHVSIQVIKHEIPSSQEKEFIFSALFYPRLFPLSSSLKLKYQISARNKKHQYSIQSDVCEINIPAK